MNDEILGKIKKLLALSKSDNEHESSQALGLVQKLMEIHNITDAMLSQHSEGDNEDIRSWEDPLHASEGKNRSQWRAQLAMSLAKPNNCEIYTEGPDIKIVGRASDVQTVRYLFSYCEKEIERLSKQYAGNGKGWINNYKIGVVQAIQDKMQESRRVVREEMIGEYGDSAKNAIVKLDNRGLETRRWYENWGKTHLKGPKTFGQQQYHDDARNAGYKDGKKIDLGNGKGLGDATRRLPG